MHSAERLKDIFSLRLRQYAVALGDVGAALKRVEDIEDDDFSPSKYTPSRNQSRENMKNILGVIKGYCLAVDDVYNKNHGTTIKLFFESFEKGLHRIEPYEVVDNDSGYQTAMHAEYELKADQAFGVALEIAGK